MMILILTSPKDMHADAMERELASREVPYYRFDPAIFPSLATMTISYCAHALKARSVSWAEHSIDLDSVKAVWFRRPGRPQPHESFEPPVADLIASESAVAINDLWETLDVLAVPGPRPVILRAQSKVRQLQIAARLGFVLPSTIVTTEPRRFLEFFEEHGGRIITKLIGPSDLPVTSDGDTVGRYTEPVRHRDVIHSRSIRYCPMIIQAYVPKSHELRITVVGARVYAASISSQEANHTKHDWRRYDDARTIMAPYELPRDLADKCLALVAALGLCYGAIDMVLTPDGRHVFLEINPSGQYLWVEQATGLPITSAIADLLAGGDRASTLIDVARSGGSI